MSHRQPSPKSRQDSLGSVLVLLLAQTYVARRRGYCIERADVAMAERQLHSRLRLTDRINPR